MARNVGFTRNIKMLWMNHAYEVYKSGANRDEFKKVVYEYLSAEIKDPTNLGKTRNILTNMWFFDEQISKGAIILIEKFPDDKAIVYWCMLIRAYPIFLDVCQVMGKMFEFDEELTLKAIKEKLFDQWGERTTLYHCVDKLAATMKNMDCIRSNRGRYTRVYHEIEDKELLIFIALTYIKAVKSSYIFLDDINEWSAMFPFKYKISREFMTEDNRFQFSAFDGKPVIILNQ